MRGLGFRQKNKDKKNMLRSKTTLLPIDVPASLFLLNFYSKMTLLPIDVPASLVHLNFYSKTTLILYRCPCFPCPSAFLFPMK